MKKRLRLSVKARMILANRRRKLAWSKVSAKAGLFAKMAVEWGWKSVGEPVMTRNTASKTHGRLASAIFNEDAGSVMEREALAAFAGDPQAARWEARHGNALFVAVENNRTEAAKELIAGGANVDGKKKRRPLMAAKSVEMGEILLSAGADPKLMGNLAGWASTPLHAACRYGSVAWVELLAPLSDIDKLDGSGSSPTDFLVEYESRCFADAQGAQDCNENRKLAALIDGGADLAARNMRGWTSLAEAVQGGLIAESLALLSAGAPFCTDVAGEGAVATALACGHRELAEKLWRAGADAQGGARGKKWSMPIKPKQKAPEHSLEAGNALHWAAKAGSLAIARHLLASLPIGSEQMQELLDEPTVVHGPSGEKRGRTALALAAGSGSEEIVKALLAAGARIDKETQEHAPTEIPEIMASLSLTSILGMAAMSGCVDTAKAILAAGEHGQDAIDEAFWCASMRGVEMMSLFAPSSVNVKVNGAPPLGMAIEFSLARSSADLVEDEKLGVAAIQELLDRGVDLNEIDESGLIRNVSSSHVEEPLLRAIRRGRVDLVKMLLGAGADVWALDWQGCGGVDMVVDQLRSPFRSNHVKMLQALGQAMSEQDPEKTERVFSRALARHAVAPAWKKAVDDEALQILAGRKEALRDARLIASFLQKDGPAAPPRKKSRL